MRELLESMRVHRAQNPQQPYESRPWHRSGAKIGDSWKKLIDRDFYLGRITDWSRMVKQIAGQSGNPARGLSGAEPLNPLYLSHFVVAGRLPSGRMTSTSKWSHRRVGHGPTTLLV
jgi:hypothetical protein